MAEIQRHYGDHLYAKHDYDGAVAQYAATIGCLEPSYVIRKFLDAQRIHNLTAYLEALHAKVGQGLSRVCTLCDHHGPVAHGVAAQADRRCLS